MAAPAGEGNASRSVPDRLLFARSLFLPEDLGGNRYPYEVVRRLGARGRRVTVVTPRLHGRFPPLVGVSYRHYPVSRRHPSLTHLTNVAGGTVALAALRGRFPVALAGSYDSALALGMSGVSPRTPLIFLFHSEFYSEWVAALGDGSPAARAREKTVAWPRGLRSAGRGAIRAYMAEVERRVFGLSARVVAVSEFSARQIRERAPSAEEKVVVIPTGVDTSYFVPPSSPEEAKRAAGCQPGDTLVLGVGRLVGVKQFDRLVRALALLPRDGSDSVRLVIAGDGPERPRLEALARELGLGQRVLFAGYCDPPRLRQLMQAADLQVCTSAFENFSLAILEGMASGTAVLGTPGGGTPELVGALDASLVLHDDEPSTIAAGIARLVSDRQELARLGDRARALTTERYDWERVVDRLEALCAQVAA